MKKCIRLLSMFVVLCSMAVVAQAAVTFRVGPSINSFGDTRITGMGSSFTMLFDLDKLSVGYKVESQGLTLSDAQNSVNNFRLSNQINALVVEKDVARVSEETPVYIGLEVGSLQATALAGTVAAPAGISQVTPELGIYGGLKYDSVGKSVLTSLFLNFGYRFVDICDVAVPAGFTAGGATFKDLNGIHIEVGAGIGF